MERKIAYQIRPEEEGRTVGWILAGPLEFSGRQIRRLKFQEDGILLAGQRVRTVQQVHSGEWLQITLREQGENRMIPGRTQLPVLYEDEDLLAVNKPPGMVTHPSPGHYADSVLNCLAAMGKNQSRFHLLGRLDRDTSGILLFAKHTAAAAALARQREKGVLQKQYLAWVSGCPAEDGGEVAFPLAPAELGRMEVSPQGKPALTRYRVVRRGTVCSLVFLTLGTGRTHQIRVHMAAIGHPLMGDPLYGVAAGEKQGAAGAGIERNGSCVPSMDRAALHAWLLRLRQPFSGERICLTAPFPEDWEQAGFS